MIEDETSLEPKKPKGGNLSDFDCGSGFQPRLTRKYRNFNFLDRIDRMFRIKIEKNLVNLVDPVEKVPPQAAKFKLKQISNIFG